MLYGKKATQVCPCGYFGDSTRECICSPFQIKKYLSKISGPLIDRFDLQVQVPRVKRDDIDAHNAQPPSISKHIRERVEIARKRQTKRFKGSGISCNAEMSTKQIKKYCVMCKEAKEFYKIIYDKYSFTMRSYNKILKIAKTIADLEQVDIITEMHIGEALQYRDYDRLIKEEVY